MNNYTKKTIDTDGHIFYYNDKKQQHRLDGPAVEWSNGEGSWHINYKPYFKKQHNRLVLFCVLEPQKVDLDAQ
jgi:hypothetical protein